VLEQSGITQDLKLLADFIADVAVVGMEFFKLAGESVGGRELGFAEAADVAASRQSAANMSRNSKMAAFSRKPLRSSRVG